MFYLANCMRILSAQFNAVFVVTNQVTGSFNDFISSSSDHKPALGLSWSNCINQRYEDTSEQYRNTDGDVIDRLMLHRSPNNSERIIQVVFSPHLPSLCKSFLITTDGITSSE